MTSSTTEPAERSAARPEASAEKYLRGVDGERRVGELRADLRTEIRAELRGGARVAVDAERRLRLAVRLVRRRGSGDELGRVDEREVGRRRRPHRHQLRARREAAADQLVVNRDHPRRALRVRRRRAVEQHRRDAGEEAGARARVAAVERAVQQRAERRRPVEGQVLLVARHVVAVAGIVVVVVVVVAAVAAVVVVTFVTAVQPGKFSVVLLAVVLLSKDHLHLLQQLGAIRRVLAVRVKRRVFGVFAGKVVAEERLHGAEALVSWRARAA